MSTPTQPPAAPTAAAPARPWFKRKRFVLPAVAVVFFAFGSAGDGGASSTTATPAPAVTVSVPGPTVTVTTGPERVVTKTVKVPGPVVTVTKTVTVQAPAPVAAVAMAGDGTYEVGVDVKPGTYVSPAPDSSCYWARMKAGDGIDNIIDNDNNSGQSVVTIKATDKFFESNGCADWTKR